MQTKRQNPSEANGAGNGFRKMKNAKSVPARKSKSERVQKNPWDSPRFIKRPIGGSGGTLPKVFFTLLLYGKWFFDVKGEYGGKCFFLNFFNLLFTLRGQKIMGKSKRERGKMFSKLLFRGQLDGQTQKQKQSRETGGKCR